MATIIDPVRRGTLTVHLSRLSKDIKYVYHAHITLCMNAVIQQNHNVIYVLKGSILQNLMYKNLHQQNFPLLRYTIGQGRRMPCKSEGVRASGMIIISHLDGLGACLPRNFDTKRVWPSDSIRIVQGI